MTPLRQLFEVARRDFVQRARSRAFLITTVLTVMVVVTLAPLLAAELGDPPPAEIGLVGTVPDGFEPAAAAIAESLGIEIETTSYGNVDEAEQELTDGPIDVLLVDGSEIVWAERENARLGTVIAGALQALERQSAIEELGLTAQEAASIVAPPGPFERIVSPPEPDRVPRQIGAQVGAFMLYMSIIIFGQFIVMGVLEEKQSRVIEVVLSRVTPERLLAGKIIGIGLLGLIQILVLGGAIVFAASLIDLPDVELPSLSMGILASVILWYLLGYAFFAAMYGAVGATITKQEDAQGAVMLPTLLVIPGLFLAMIAIEDPNSLAVVIGSFVPFSAPMVMPVRMASGAVAWWEVGVAVVLLALTAWLMIRIAARVFSGAALSIGPKVRLRDAWRASTPAAPAG